MARIVGEIMNSELLALRGDETVAEAVASMIALEIAAIPVLDKTGAPIGMVDLRSLLEARPDLPARQRAKWNAVVIPASLPIDVAARTMAQTGEHRLVVVDDAGRAIGIVSTLDVLRGLNGVPVSHPPAFPHFDSNAGVSWSDDRPIDAVNALNAPDEPGVLVLVHGAAGETERVVWARACTNVRQRISALAMNPCLEASTLTRALRRGKLRFRTAKVADPTERDHVVAIVLGRAMGELAARRAASA
jgi:CBS domain-containing protein